MAIFAKKPIAIKMMFIYMPVPVEPRAKGFVAYRANNIGIKSSCSIQVLGHLLTSMTWNQNIHKS